VTIVAIGVAFIGQSLAVEAGTFVPWLVLASDLPAVQQWVQRLWRSTRAVELRIEARDYRTGWLTMSASRILGARCAGSKRSRHVLPAATVAGTVAQVTVRCLPHPHCSAPPTKGWLSPLREQHGCATDRSARGNGSQRLVGRGTGWRIEAASSDEAELLSSSSHQAPRCLPELEWEQKRANLAE